MLELDNKLTLDKETLKAVNLTDSFSEEDLKKIGMEVWEGYCRDKQSRLRWEQRNEAGMNLALQLQEAKSFPWANCSNVAFPLVTIAAMQFHARAYPAIISGEDIAKCRVIGTDTDGSQTERAERVSTHMSWQCLEEDQSWEEQHDRGLLNVGIIGTNFMKSYYDAAVGHQVSELVHAKDLVLDYFAKSVETAPRKTQVIPLPRNDIFSKAKRGVYRDVLEEPWFKQPPVRNQTQIQIEADKRHGKTISTSDMNTPFQGLEQHVLMDLDQDGYAEPYIITLEEQNQYVLRIVTGCDREEDIERGADNSIISVTQRQYYTKYGLIPSPDGGIYDIGFGVLLGPLNESVNSAINQLFDAGTMSVAAGGFLARGAKIRGGTYTFSPFQWQRVDSSGDDLRKSLYPLPVREPNGVLFQLLSLLIDYTNRVSGANDMMVGENPGQNTPASTAQAMVEQGSKIYAAIFKRIWRAMKEEFKKRYILNALFIPENGAKFGAGKWAMKADYLGSPDSIAPAADPNISSDGQAMAQIQAVKASAMQTPGYDTDEVEKWYLKRLKVPDIERLFPGTKKLPPGKSEKIQIQEMKNQLGMMQLQAGQQTEMARLQLEEQKTQAEIQNLQAEVQLKMVELQGDMEDREIQKLNAMLSLAKDKSVADKARMDVLGKHMEVVMKQIEAAIAAQEADMRQIEIAHAIRDQAREDKKVSQKDRELDIKQQIADKPVGKAA